MLDRVHPPGRLRTVAALVAAATLLGAAGSARAGSYECRGQIGKEAKALLAAGLRSVDQCHKKRDRVCVPFSMRSECNFLPSSNTDPRGLYVAREATATGKVASACAPGDPVLASYPGGVAASLWPALSSDVGGNAQVLLGDDDLLCDRAKTRCLRAIAAARSAVVKEVVADSVRCQRGRDKGATSFGALDPSCLDAGDRTSANAASRIQRSCIGVPAEDVGTCSPLPSCAIGSAVLTGQSIAKAIYATPPGCGNGVLDANEQCDDDNEVSGDGCSASCEIEGASCTPYGGPGGATGTRVVKVTLSTPEPLAGLQVSIDYPQFQSGIPGTGSSSIVQSRFTTLQPAGLAAMNDRDTDVAVGMINIVDGFDSGDLFEITFDNCVALSESICNRVQSIISCTGGDSPPACGTAPPEGVIGACSTAGGCPGDNFCVPQTEVTGCSVSDPVDDLGQPVAGVSCSVTITEQP